MQFSFLEELNNKGLVIIYVEGGEGKNEGGWGQGYFRLARGGG